LYGIPKIKMEYVLLRPTINCIASGTHFLAQYLVAMVSPTTGHYITNITSSE
jgi:hypothetical protein